MATEHTRPDKITPAGTALLLLGSTIALLTAPDAAIAVSAPRQGSPTFTVEQMTVGRNAYGASCSSCHGADLSGASGPPLRGAAFERVWLDGTKTAGDLYRVVRTSMPKLAPGSLEADNYRAIVAFILSSNGFAPAGEPLDDATATAPLSRPGSGPTAAAQAHNPTRVSLPIPRGPVTVSAARGTMPDDAGLLHPADGDWLMFNRTYDGQRYSPLRQIRATNARRLRPVCIYQTGETGAFQSTPVAYRNTLYFTQGFNTYAIDARTCAPRWTHHQSGEAGFLSANRGVTLYRGKVLRGTADGHLIALDAETGELLWDSVLVDTAAGHAFTGAPIAFDGRVFIGTAGADWGANGRIFAVATETGQPLWSFDVIPTGNEPGAETWGAGAELGGGSAWSTLSLDPDRSELLVSIGNPAPDFNGALRPGANLYTNSVVSLDYRTGTLRWYVQQIPHDVHDFDTAAAPVLYASHAEPRMAVGSKDGLLYLYRRDTHELLGRAEVSPRKNLDVPLSLAGTYHCPGYNGGVQWHGPGYSPEHHLLVVNSTHWCGTTKIVEDRYVRGALYLGGVQTPDPPEAARGYTHGVDADTGRVRWARESQSPMIGATTVTAGGVVLTGDVAGNFLILDLANGREIYRFQTGGVVASGPTTYVADGRQFVAVGSGNNSKTSDFSRPGAGTVVVFALDGNQ